MPNVLVTDAGFVLMLTPQIAPWRGLTQRVAEAAVLAWTITVAFRAGRRR